MGTPTSPPAESAESPVSKLVQMRLRRPTLEKLDDLHGSTGIENRTQLVATSIDLAHWLMRAQEAGGRLVVEYDDGRREVVAIVGL